MFEDLVQDLILNSESLSSYLQRMYDSDIAITEIRNDILDAKYDILTEKNKTKSSYLRKIRKSVLSSIDMQGILAEKIKEAATTSIEYGNYELFINKLLMAARSDNNFIITPNGTGFNTKLNVITDMDSTAGTLGEYAVGVESYRNELGTTSNPRRGSAVWKYRVYGNANQTRYEKTIEERVSRSGSIAPFWRLFDEGSMLFMTSAYGGTPFPNEKGADFTGNTSKAIQEEFKNSMKNEQEFVDSIKTKVVSLEKKIQLLKVEIDKRVLDITSKINTGEVQNVVNSYGNDLDRDKLIKLLDSIITGREIRTQSQGRVQLGKKGKDVRKKLESFIGAVQ